MSSILITEYFMSTFNPYINEHSILAEACGMVFSLIKTLKALRVNIILTVSKYLINTAKKKFPDINFVVINEGKYLDEIELLKDLADFVIAIAPPASLIAIASIVKNKFLGPSYNIVNSLSNKYEALVTLQKCGIKVPRTLICNDSRELNIHKLEPPIVVKPSMLAGSECVYVVNDLDKLRRYIDTVIKCDPKGHAVIQEYIPGFHGSISAVFYEGKPKLVSLNLQLISIKDNKVKFYGNVLPLRASRYVYWSLDIVNKITCLSELKGYIGLDVVWNDSGMYVVEVNPRFTTSGIGVVELYPALGGILLGRAKPRNVYLGKEVTGYAYIVKSVDHQNSTVNYNELCLKGLTYGITETYDKVLEKVLYLNPEVIKLLPYDIKSSSLTSNNT
ncbi:MAG: ATP-grasp domain-containing protein [Ignisphaera sp.]